MSMIGSVPRTTTQLFVATAVLEAGAGRCMVRGVATGRPVRAVSLYGRLTIMAASGRAS